MDTKLMIQNIIKKQEKNKNWVIDELKNNIDKIKIKDCSKGCDNLVYLVSIDDGNSNSDDHDKDQDDNKIIIRMPRRLGKSECPIMHTPKMQAKLLQVIESIKLNDIGIKTPKLISLDSDDRFLIESYVPSQDLSELFSTPSEMNDNQCNIVFSKIGTILKRIHTSIPTVNGTFGSLKSIDLKGELSNWNDFFEKDFIEQFKTMDINIDYMNDYKANENHKFENKQQVIDLLLNLYLNDIKHHLVSFNNPSLVHADLCSNNIRISSNNNELKVTGIIDFADAISGDGLYDLGRILSHFYGEWRVIEAMEIGYCGNHTPFNQTQRKLIIFYALSFCCWLLDVSYEVQDILKYNQILSSLLTLYLKNK